MSANFASLFLLIIEYLLYIGFYLLQFVIAHFYKLLRFGQLCRQLVKLERVLLKALHNGFQPLHGLFVGQFLLGHKCIYKYIIEVSDLASAGTESPYKANAINDAFVHHFTPPRS